MTEAVPLLRSLFHTTLVLLPSLSCSATIVLVLLQTEKLIPYITGFRKLIKQLIASVLDIWSRRVRPAGRQLSSDSVETLASARPYYGGVLCAVVRRADRISALDQLIGQMGGRQVWLFEQLASRRRLPANAASAGIVRGRAAGWV